MRPAQSTLVWTIKERCRVCYTCVRECPAKAIRISEHKAEVIPQRCIACGNCVRVCSQRAKEVVDDVGRVEELLRSGERIAACLAPSFPAEFFEFDHESLVGMLRMAGFDLVCEVAFGADLVASAYRRLLSDEPAKRFIGTTCPGIFGYVERYHPDMIDSLAPIVSPMIAMSRALRRRHGPDLRIVFIGPCIAKKGEASSAPVAGDVDAVLTFPELRRLLKNAGIEPTSAPRSEFDPPRPGLGSLFPISRGLLQAAKIDEDLVQGDIVSATGRGEFGEALREFESGHLDARLVDALCCQGCVMGPATTVDAPLFLRRSRVSRYVRSRMVGFNAERHAQEMAEFADVDLTRKFMRNDQRISAPSEMELRQIMERLGKFTLEDELNCGACGYETCREHAIAIFKGLADSEMCLPYTLEELRRTCTELTLSNQELATTQEALMQSEKLAHMGQLAAGIAHEVNNPLGTVVMLSHLLLDETAGDSPMVEDLKLMASEADRCKKIVSGLLQFARKNKVEAQQADVAELVERAVRSVRPGDYAVDVRVETEASDTTADVDGDQIMQVLINLFSNAVAAMPGGGHIGVRISGDESRIKLAVRDTGCGIPKDNIRKIFEPFFTTKPPGQGTGLGLAVTYGIVKMHHGDIRVDSNADPTAGPTWTQFIVTLPRRSLRPASDEMQLPAGEPAAGTA